MRRGLGLRCLAVLGVLALAGCAGPAPPAVVAEPAPVQGVGYVFLNAPITTSTRDLFIQDVGKLRAAGATQIDLAINSGGGDVEAAEAIVDYMHRLHDREGVTFKAYNAGIVASAATFIYLNAQDRYSPPRGAFLFHAAGLVSSGPVNAQALREQADKLDAYERLVRATLHARSRLTDPEATIYIRRTVVLSADDARRDGIVDAIAAFTPPVGARMWVIQPTPAKGAATPKPVVSAPG